MKEIIQMITKDEILSILKESLNYSECYSCNNDYGGGESDLISIVADIYEKVTHKASNELTTIFIPEISRGICGHDKFSGISGREISFNKINKYGRTYAYSYTDIGCKECNKEIKQKALDWIEKHNEAAKDGK